jgi:DNA-binding beta-propeller fold protein YncE
MIPLTQFKNMNTNIMKTKILRNILLSLGVFFALAINTHAQNLYVSINGDFCGFQCTNSNGSISEYTPAGMVTIASSLARPRGLAFDSSGNLFAAVTRRAPPKGQYQGKILKFPPLGHQSVLGTVPQSFLEGVVTDSGGNTFALAQDAKLGLFYPSTIYKFAPDGTGSIFGSIPGQGNGLAFDSEGNLFAADGGAPGISPSIYKFTSDGTRTVFAGPNAFTDGTGPAGLAFDASGNLFVSTEGDPGNDTILEFTPNGMESTFAPGLTNPLGLAFDGSGNLFVVEENPGPDGDILKFGPGGAETVFASGLNYPEDLAFGPPR